MKPGARRLAIVCAAAVLLGIAAYAVSPWGPSQRSTTQPAVLATGDPAGLYDAYGRALASAAARGSIDTLTIIETAGVVENLDRLRSGAATFALVTADHADALPSGRAVARLFDNYVHLIVRAELQVYRAADLRGLRVSVGDPGSGTSRVADRVLEAAGLRPGDLLREELRLTDAVAALQEGRTDAIFVSEGLRSPVVSRLWAESGIRLVDLGEIAGRLSTEVGSPYVAANIPAGTYPWLVVPIVTVAVPSLLLTTAETGDALVRDVTALLFESASEIATRIPAVGQVNRYSAIFTGTVPLHRGAREYYRSAKAYTAAPLR